MKPEHVESRLALARTLADAVDVLSLAAYQSPDLEVMYKPDGSVVTPTDREAERILREGITGAFPEDAILGEEEGDTPGRSGWRWVLDPIDGTESFSRGIPHYSTLIGIEFEETPVAGVASFPALGERLHAAVGRGAHWATRSGSVRSAAVSATRALSEAIIEVGSPRAFARQGCAAVRRTLIETARRTRGWSDGYAYALVATGRVDAAVQIGLKRWDISAFVPIITEAGGYVGDWTTAGTPWNGRVLGCTPGIATELARALAGR